MDYQKKTIYLSYMENEKRICNGGHVRLEGRGTRVLVDMHVKLKHHVRDGKCNVMLNEKNGSFSLGMLYIQSGAGSLIREIDNQFAFDDIFDIRMIMDGNTYVIGKVKEREDNRVKEIDFEQFKAEPPGKEWQYAVIPAAEDGEAAVEKDANEEEAAQETLQTVEPVQKAEIVAACDENPDFSPVLEESVVSVQPHQEDVRQILHDIRMVPDKWQQLLNNYEQINPYADERLYISIEPKDFVIMSSEYHQLAHNSFLLHGYYNYRHIILGRENGDYYLGVPGVYYEREKNVALMFGFEVFECEGGKAANGMFGYYLRKVVV